MMLIKSFLVGGLICGLSEIIMNKFKILPIHLTCGLVIIGGSLEIFGIYDKLISFAGFGAKLPISNFGHSLVHAAIEQANNTGYLGVFTGVYSKVSSGISFSILIAFICGLVFRSKN